ncbi:MAG: DsbC family protein [Burkholderiales bacterium]
MNRVLAAAALFAAVSSAGADEAAVRRMMQDKLRGGGAIESIQKAPWGDLYEVVVRGRDGPLIYYVDNAASVIIAGQAFDAKSGRNLTEERQRKLSAITWDSLPLQWAITSVRGTGRRKIAILSDPNCPFCKRFEEDLAKLDDITVHILPYAVIKPESVRQAKAVWCSRDRVKAWNDMMFRRIEPQVGTDCDNPVEKLIEFGRKLGANSTPTWFLENGERYSGAMSLEQVRALLDAASPPKR